MERVKPEIQSKINEKLNECIEKAGNVTAFAQSIGVSRDSVNNWLRGKSDIRLNDLVTIRQKYNVSVDYLLGLSPNPAVDENVQTAIAVTGLSEKAIGLLQLMRVNSGYMRSVNFLLEQIAFYREVIGAVKKVLDSLAAEEIVAEDVADDELALLDQLERRGWLIGSPLACAAIYSDRAGLALHDLLEKKISPAESSECSYDDRWIMGFDADNEQTGRI